MLKGFFTALSSKVFGSGQSEAASSNEGSDENSSSNALKEKSDKTDGAGVSTESVVQEKEKLKKTATDVVVPEPAENKNNSGVEVNDKEISASVVYTKRNNDASGQETSHVTNKELDQGKGEMTDTKSENSPSPKCDGQDMSEWVTLETPKGKRSPKKRKSRSPKVQNVKSPSQNQKSLLDSDDVMIQKTSSAAEMTNSKLEKTEKGAKAGGDGVETLENNSGHLNEDLFSSMLVSSVLDEIVSQMSEVTVKDTVKESKSEDTRKNGQMSEVTVKDSKSEDTSKNGQMSEVTVKDTMKDNKAEDTNQNGQMSDVTVNDTVKESKSEDTRKNGQMSEVTKENSKSEDTSKNGQMSEVTVKDAVKDNKAEDTNQNANQDPAVPVKPQDDNWRVKPQDDNWRDKRQNKQRNEYCREKPQRGKKGMNRRGHRQGYNDDCPPADREHGEGKEINEEMKKLPPIDPNLEQDNFLQFCKMSTERDKLIRAKKLIYKLGYLKDVPPDEIKDVILGQYKIAARRSVHGWIEDARYFAEVMIASDWIDENLLYLNPRMNKKSSNKRSKNRYMEKEDSFARKTGGLCQDVRLLTNPNLTVVRVNMKSNGHVETIKEGDEAKGDRESTEVGSGGEKLAKTEKGDQKTTKDLDGKEEDGVRTEKGDLKTTEGRDGKMEDGARTEDGDLITIEEQDGKKEDGVGTEKGNLKTVEGRNGKMEDGARTEDGDLITIEEQDGKKEDGLEVGVVEDDKEKVIAEDDKEDDEDKFEDCLEESVKCTDITEEEEKESEIFEKIVEDNSSKALEEMKEPVEQGEVAEVIAQMEECVISPKEQDLNFDGDKDVHNKDLELKEDCDDKESPKNQVEEFVTSNDSFTDPAIIMMVKASSNSESLPEQPSYATQMPSYDPKCDVLSGLFRIEEDPRSLIETIMSSDSPTEPSVTREYPQAVMMSQDDPTMVVENDSQLIDYLLTVAEEPKNPTMFPEISCNVENSSDSLAELEGIDEFLTDMVTSKICNEDIITDIDTAGIGDGGFGEEVVNLDLVKDESVMMLIEQCRTEDLAEGESCEGAGEALALEGQLLGEGETKESIQHFGNPVESDMVYNLLQDLPILHTETSTENSKEDFIGLTSEPDHQLTGDPACDELKEAVVGEVTKDSTIAISYQGPDHAQLEIEVVESQSDKEPYSPTQKCLEPYSPAKNVNEPKSSTENLVEPISTSPD